MPPSVPGGAVLEGLLLQGAAFDGVNLAEVEGDAPSLLPTPLCTLAWATKNLQARHDQMGPRAEAIADETSRWFPGCQKMDSHLQVVCLPTAYTVHVSDYLFIFLFRGFFKG